MPAKRNLPADAGRWRALPLVSLLVRAVLLAAPVVAGMAGALILSRLPRPSGPVPWIAWWLAMIAGTIAPVVLVERATRRWLPLAALLELSLVFPDRMPSRLEVVRRAGRTRDLEKRLEEARRRGIRDEPTRAAETILALITSLGSHDRKSRGHSERVRVLADLLAEKAGVPSAERDRFRWGALLHDVGKVAVPAKILNKPGRPDRNEWSILRQHPVEGARMAGPLRAWLGPWAGAIEHHHEWYDGAGYPYGLAGKEISLGGRILAVADAYEVMTAVRSYKEPMSARAARLELARSAGTQFDPALVRAFLDISLGRLVWAIGLAALLAQVPVLGWLWRSRLADRFGRAAAHATAATALVAAVALPGAIASHPPVDGGSRIEALGRAGVSDRLLEPGPRSAGEEGRAGSPAGSPMSGKAPGGSGSGPDPVAHPPDSSKDGDDPHEEPPPEDPPRQEEPEPATFSASGRITAGNPLSPSRGGITLNEFLLSCDTPSSQGIDGWVFELPSAFPERGATASARGDNAAGSYDLDMRFFSARCDFLGAVRTEQSDEVGVVPAGTHFVVVSETRGLDTGVRITVTAN